MYQGFFSGYDFNLRLKGDGKGKLTREWVLKFGLNKTSIFCFKHLNMFKDFSYIFIIWFIKSD